MAVAATATAVDGGRNKLKPTAPSSGPLNTVAVGSERWKLDIEGPFRRLDPNPDAFELARLALCAVTIVPIRALLIGTFILTYYILAFCFMRLAPDRPWAHAVSVYCLRMASWFVLFLMGYWKIDVTGLEENAGRKDEPRVFVSNHIGYIEILYFLWQLGPSFVMKRTCLRVPLIGSIAAQIIDSVPVDNKGGKMGGSGSEAIAARLSVMFGKEALETGVVAQQQQHAAAVSSSPSSSSSSSSRSNGNGPHTCSRPKRTTVEENWARGWKGNPLLLFPEGTTSNGSCVLRFKTGVFAGGVPVHPVTIKYKVRRFSPAFESIYFPVHAFRSLAEPVQHLSVEYLPRFDPTPEQQADRMLYAKAVQRVFCKSMNLPAADAGYAEKTKYHIYLRKQFQLHPWGVLALLLPSPDRHRIMLESRGRKNGSRIHDPVEGSGKGDGVMGDRGDDAVPSGVDGMVIPDGGKPAGRETVLRRRMG